MQTQTSFYATVITFLLLQSTSVLADLPSVGFQVEIYAAVTDPNGIAIAADGTVYTGRDNSFSGGGFSDPVKIHVIAIGGSPVEEYGITTIADPDVVAVDELGLVSGIPGTIIVGGNAVGHNGSPVGGSLISAVSPSEVVSTLIHVPGPVGHDINGLAFDSTGRLFFSTNSAVYSATDTNPTVFAALGGGIRPGGIDIDADDNIYVRWEDAVVRKYDTSGVLQPFSFSTLGNIAISAGGPFGNGSIYTIEEDELRLVDATSRKFTLGSGFGSVGNQPAFGPNGDLYVTQISLDRVLRISAPLVSSEPQVNYASGNSDPGVSSTDLLSGLDGTVSGSQLTAFGNGSLTTVTDGIWGGAMSEKVLPNNGTFESTSVWQFELTETSNIERVAIYSAAESVSARSSFFVEVEFFGTDGQQIGSTLEIVSGFGGTFGGSDGSGTPHVAGESFASLSAAHHTELGVDGEFLANSVEKISFTFHTIKRDSNDTIFRPDDATQYSWITEIDVFGTVVPEPSTALLGSLAGLLFYPSRRRV